MSEENTQTKTELAKLSQPTMTMTRRGFEPQTFDEAWRFANALAKSSFVPANYQNNPGDCLVAIDWAARVGCSPLAVLQNTYVVHGRPGMFASFQIGLMNTSGLFKDPIDFETEGDDPFDIKYRVRAFAVRVKTGKVLYGPWIDWKLVRAEKWDTKDGSKWKTMPAQMFLYRAAAWFGRAFCPEATLGMLTREELEEMEPTKTVESHEIRGVAGVVQTLKDRQNEKTTGTGTSETPTTTTASPLATPGGAVVGSEPPKRGRPRKIADVAVDPGPVANIPDPDPSITTEGEGEEVVLPQGEPIYVCLMCKSKGRPHRFMPSELKGGNHDLCPACISGKNLVQESEIQ